MRLRRTGFVLLLLAIAALTWNQRQQASTAQADVRHAALHINCPPGSHGVPRTDGAGRSLKAARDRAKAARDAATSEE